MQCYCAPFLFLFYVLAIHPYPECDHSVQFLTFYQIWFLRFRASSDVTIVVPVHGYTLYFEVCSGYLTIITACCNNTILLEIIAKQIIGPHDEHEVSFFVSEILSVYHKLHSSLQNGFMIWLTAAFSMWNWYGGLMFGEHMMKLNVKNILNFLNNDTHVDKRGYLLKKGEVHISMYCRFLNFFVMFHRSKILGTISHFF